jgi:hypothetical protein
VDVLCAFCFCECVAVFSLPAKSPRAQTHCADSGIFIAAYLPESTCQVRRVLLPGLLSAKAIQGSKGEGEGGVILPVTGPHKNCRVYNIINMMWARHAASRFSGVCQGAMIGSTQSLATNDVLQLYYRSGVSNHSECVHVKKHQRFCKSTHPPTSICKTAGVCVR